MVEGRAVEVLPTREHPRPDVDCHGRYRGVDLRQAPLIQTMAWDGERLSDGRTSGPTSGRHYKLLPTLEGPGRLNARGFLGVKALGRTQVWRRAR